MKKQINIPDLLYILELEPSCMDFIKKGYHQALVGVDEFKELVKKQRKRLAIKHHPDRNSGDDALMKEVNNAADLLLMIEIKPIPPPQLRPMVRVFRFDLGTAYTNTTDSTYTWSG